MSHWSFGNGGYHQLGVPMPADEDRMYPTLQDRDHRILSPPTDAPRSSLSPSAPVYGVVNNSASALQIQQQQQAQAQAQAALYSGIIPINSYEHKNNPPTLPPRTNANGYIPVPNEPGQPIVNPGILPPPIPSSQSFQYPPSQTVSFNYSQQPGESLQPPTTIEELSDRVKNLPISSYSLGSLFRLSWRFVTSNICSYLGSQILIFGVLVAIFMLWHYLYVSQINNHYNYYHDNNWLYRWYLTWGVLYLVGGCFLVVPMVFALVYNTLRGIQTNRFISIAQSFKFFTTHYCSFLFYSFLSTVVFFLPNIRFIRYPGFGLLFFLVTFIFFQFFPFTLMIKYQFPTIGTFKAMGISARIAKQNFCRIFTLNLILAILNIIAFVLFGVGLLITLPMTICLYSYVYKQLVGIHSVTGYVEGRGEYSYDGTGGDNQVAGSNPAPVPAAPVQYVQVIQMQPMHQTVPAMAGYPGAIPVAQRV